MGGPAFNAIMSHRVLPTEQGELQGATSSITSLTSVGAMWAMPTLFAWFTAHGAPIYFPGAAFLAAALRIGRLAVPLASGDAAASGSFQPFQFVFYSEFLFFEGRDGLHPIGMGHFGGDDFFKFFMLNSQMLDLSFYRHAYTSSV